MREIFKILEQFQQGHQIPPKRPGPPSFLAIRTQHKFGFFSSHQFGIFFPFWPKFPVIKRVVCIGGSL